MTSVEEEAAAGDDDLAHAKTVLLLDDDPNTLLVLEAVLERTDARVIGCEDEPCAVQWCNDLLHGIDLVVADVILKQTNGPNVVRKIRPMQPLMRLLYISGFSLDELERRGLLYGREMSPGRVEFLQKPFSPEEFLARVGGLLASRS
jgi:response regulator RpfG family c-di-GMP phosphodiesterase